MKKTRILVYLLLGLQLTSLAIIFLHEVLNEAIRAYPIYQMLGFAAVLALGQIVGNVVASTITIIVLVVQGRHGDPSYRTALAILSLITLGLVWFAAWEFAHVSCLIGDGCEPSLYLDEGLN